MAPNSAVEAQKNLEAISATLKSLGVVAGSVGASTFPAEVESFGAELSSINKSSLGDDGVNKLRTLAERVAGWKERFYNEFTPVQKAIDQSMNFLSN